MLSKGFLSFLFITFFALVTHAQQQDFVMQPMLSLEKKLSRSFTARVAGQAFINENAAELSSVFAEASLAYRLTNNISLIAGYRQVAQRNLDNRYDDRELYNFAITYSKSRRNMGIGFRMRYQSLWYGDFGADNFRRNRDYLRTRLTFKYRLNYYWSPYVECEFFNPLNRPNRQGFDQLRYTVGFVRTINDQLRIEPYFMVMELIARESQKRYHVLGLSTTFRMK
jgi:hypothetical protein